MSPLYRILSLDGGGIRGLLTTCLLERLAAACPGFLEQVDLFAGASSGALTALALAAGWTPTQCRQFYEHYGPAVFADSFWDNVRDLGHAIGAQYSSLALKDFLSAQFGTRALGDLPRRVLIAAFDLDNAPTSPLVFRQWKPKFFHNFPATPECASDAHELIVDVALRTSAAPTYFPIYQGYIDGGVAANNPATCALAQALNNATGRQKLEDVVLLSLGVGRNSRYLSVQDADWGWVQWGPHLIDLLLEATSDIADYQCRQLLGAHYLRLNPLLSEQINLDSVDKIERLKEIAAAVDLTAPITWLRTHFI